jgi:hypothetical protein
MTAYHDVARANISMTAYVDENKLVEMECVRVSMDGRRSD